MEHLPHSSGDLSNDRESLLFRRAIYAVFIAIAVGGMVGRIATVESADGQWPFLSANDRSRWCTIRALVDHQTYAIDEVIETPGWDSIDKVRHADAQGHYHYYSSKPPLLPTLLAGPCWVIQQLTGANMTERPFLIGRIMLVLSNVLPMIVCLGLITLMVERYAQDDWTKLYLVAAACFGTQITTFAVSLSNHLPAVVGVTIALWAALRIWNDHSNRVSDFVITGIAAAFVAANELPALSFLAAVSVAMLIRNWKRTVVAYLPAVGLVVAAFFGTNYLAHHDWMPAYAHRHEGSHLISFDGSWVAALDRESVAAQKLPDRLLEKIPSPHRSTIEELTLRQRYRSLRWILVDRTGNFRYGLDSRNGKIDLYQWGNWYEYYGSYWMAENKRGVDRGEANRGLYIFHCLLGHRGLFSLTPIWLFSAVGCGWLLKQLRYRLAGIAVMTIALSVVCLAFYFSRSQMDRNYGGVSCCFRWMLWFIPLWLMMMIPTVEWLGHSRWGRAIAIGLLAISVASASFAGANPWQHSWIFQYGESLGWPMMSNLPPR